jgi:transcriptional regulator
MHPNSTFRWDDRAELLQFVSQHAFAHLFISVENAPMVAHVPVVVIGDCVQFHLARQNRLVAHLDGATALLSVTGANCYISPDWYALPSQVPTWLYRAVEVEGVVRRLDDVGLIAQVDLLSQQMEAKLAPKPIWTRTKMAEGRFAAMLPGIVGFELNISALRGTKKLNQHKPQVDIEAMLQGLRGNGDSEVARLVEACVGARV